MRLCKIQAAGESDPVNQALRHRPVVGQIVFVDLLMYASDAVMGLCRKMNRRKRKLKTGRASGVSSSAGCCHERQRPQKTVQTSCNRSSTADGSTRNASQPITTGAYMRYNRSNEPSTDMAPRIRAETIPFSGGSCCSSPISIALVPTLLCRDLGLFAEHR